MTHAELLEMTADLKGTLTISDKVRIAAVYYDVDANLALNIACAESQFIETARNPNSTATGVYQWLVGSWAYYTQRFYGTTEGKMRDNADDNIELSMLVLSTVGSADWEASKWEGIGGGWARDPIGNGYCTV